MDEKEIDDSLESKKRDHKIEITDVAIEKVPYIEYEEIPCEHYEIIQILAKRVLKLSRDKNHGNETAITYSMDLLDEFSERTEKGFGISYGDEHSVAPFANPIAAELVHRASGSVILVIHNHPSLSKVSLQYVWLFLKYVAVKMIVVVTNQGTIDYIVKSDKYDRLKALELFGEALEKERDSRNLKEKQDAAKHFLRNCIKAGIIYKD